MEDSIAVTNEHFGGLNPRTYNILMTQGEMDPMRTLGPNQDLNSQARVITIHCKINFLIKINQLIDILYKFI